MALAAGPFHCFWPGPPLADFVDFLWLYDGYVAPHAQERLLPAGTMELVFRLDADGTDVAGLMGPRSEFLALDTSRPFSAIGVHFRPGGGFPFFGVPGCELHNRSVTLEMVWGAYARTISASLWEATTPERRFRILEDALKARAHGSLERHPAVRYALAVFNRSSGACRIGDVVERTGLSSRRFVDRFQSEVGLSPKAFCRVRRFNEVLRRIEGVTEVDWADVALSCGYFDQAHFNHDFRAFAGLSPSTYLRHRVTRTHVAVIG
jgi:AraC-like DNA-binding protein